MPDNVTHIWKMLNLMSALTEDNRFENALADKDRKKSVNTMSEVLDRIENRGIKIGSNNIIIKLYGKLGDAAQVADLLDLDEAEVEKVISEK